MYRRIIWSCATEPDAYSHRHQPNALHSTALVLAQTLSCLTERKYNAMHLSNPDRGRARAGDVLMLLIERARRQRPYKSDRKRQPFNLCSLAETRPPKSHFTVLNERLQGGSGVAALYYSARALRRHVLRLLVVLTMSSAGPHTRTRPPLPVLPVMTARHQLPEAAEFSSSSRPSSSSSSGYGWYYSVDLAKR